jgi:hypothetical protein
MILGFKVVTRLVTKNSVFWDIMPCKVATFNPFHGGSLIAVFLTLNMNATFLPKRRFIYNRLRGINSQKMEQITVTI